MPYSLKLLWWRCHQHIAGAHVRTWVWSLYLGVLLQLWHCADAGLWCYLRWWQQAVARIRLHKWMLRLQRSCWLHLWQCVATLLVGWHRLHLLSNLVPRVHVRWPPPQQSNKRAMSGVSKAAGPLLVRLGRDERRGAEARHMSLLHLHSCQTHMHLHARRKEAIK